MGAACSTDNCDIENCTQSDCNSDTCSCTPNAKNDARVAAGVMGGTLIAALLLGSVTAGVDWNMAAEEDIKMWIIIAGAMFVLLAVATHYANWAWRKAPEDKKAQCLAAALAPWAALFVWIAVRIQFTWGSKAYDAASAMVYGVLFGTMVLLSITTVQL